MQTITDISIYRLAKHHNYAHTNVASSQGRPPFVSNAIAGGGIARNQYNVVLVAMQEDNLRKLEEIGKDSFHSSAEPYLTLFYRMVLRFLWSL